MCGLSAVIATQKRILPSQLVAMNKTLKHRGPDGQGTYLSDDGKVGFTHHRLSLVELSAKGSQPMSKHDRTIIFNGEIYNWQQLLSQLKDKGYVFLSHSDTEVILTAFEEWGIQSITKFNGAFAFILYEHRTGDVYVVRDRIGEKPMYYTQKGSQLLFASEIKAFVAAGIRLIPNIDTIRTNLIFHFFADKGETYFTNIQSLRPGHYMKITGGACKIVKYWDIHPKHGLSRSQEKKQIDRDLNEIYDLLEDAIKIRLSADCRVGALLSGGVDSSLMSTVAAKVAKYPITCFTLRVKGKTDQDLRHAKELVRHDPRLRHVLIDLTNKKFSLKNVDRITKHLEEIVLHRVSVYVNTNYQTIRSRGIKAVLNGQGSDEIACGYLKYYPFHSFKDSNFTFDNFSTYWYEQFAFKKYCKKNVVRDLIDHNLNQNYRPFLGRDRLNAVLAFGLKTHLLNILNHEDRFSMAESVECRTVYTDYRLIEKFMSIPSRQKIWDGREKYHIRKLGERHLPKTITTRAKLGYPDFSQHFEQLFVDQVFAERGFASSALIPRVFDGSIYKDVRDFPLSLQWKLATLYRFENVFLS